MVWTKKNRWRGGRIPRKLVITYESIAREKGVSVQAVRRAAERKTLDIEDLQSICRYLSRRRGPEKKKGE